MSEPQNGGSEWELSEAIRLMGDAQASGDPAQIATAMRRHAEALTNATNTTMIPTLKNVLETVVQKETNALAVRIDATVQHQDQRFGYILDQFGAFLEKEDTRHGAYDALLQEQETATLRALTSVAVRLDQITALVQQGIVTGVKALAVGEKALAIGEKALAIAKAGQTRLTKIEHQYDAIVQQLNHGEHELVLLAEKLDLYIAGSKRGEVEALQVQIRELHGAISPEQRQRYIAVLLRIIAEWEAAHPDDVT